MTEYVKDELFSEHLQYTGKTLKKKGEKDGHEWKLWKLNFEVGKQYPWQVSAFGSIGRKSGLKLEDLEEGEFYEVVYKVASYEHATHGTVKTKTAVLLKESSEDKNTAGQLGGNKSSPSSPSSQSIENKIFVISPEEWAQFSSEYLEAMGDKGNSMHLLGAFVANHYKEQFGQVIGLCKQTFEQ